MENSGGFNRQPIGPTNECKPCTKWRQSSALPQRKLLQSHVTMTTEKQQRIVLKRLVKQRNHHLSLARMSFKNQENIKRKR